MDKITKDILRESTLMDINKFMKNVDITPTIRELFNNDDMKRMLMSLYSRGCRK